MWAYLAAYKTPHDDAGAQARRVHVDYPIVADRILGLGELPSTPPAARARPQRARTARAGARSTACSCGRTGAGSRSRTARSLYILVRRPRRFPRAAVMTYAVFDIGAIFYWLVPTAPPWYAAGAREDGATGEQLEVRRMMVEYGEDFWQDGWGSLYSVFGGNPLAAMPSLHFATSLMAALLLAEVGAAGGRARRGVRGHARLRARLPRRALRRRSARRRRA